VIEAHAAPIVDTISPEAIYQRISGALKAAEVRAIEWMPDRLCAMEQNSVSATSTGANAAEPVERRAGAKGNAHQQSTHWTQNQARVSQALERIRQAIVVIHPRWEKLWGGRWRLWHGKPLLTPKVIPAVIGIIGIPLLAFSFGQIKPFGLAAHLAIQNQKGLTIEALPLGISVADGSGGETVTVGGLAEGSFVGVMTAKVTLNSATGKRLDTRDVRFEWSTPEPYSAPPAEQTEPTPGAIVAWPM